ncbi:MAG TPA: hypothetical protein PK420_11080, partial [Rubrivivax sp.]|nr:hypothetical protein [Rubrivivax sp.]
AHLARGCRGYPKSSQALRAAQQLQREAAAEARPWRLERTVGVLCAEHDGAVDEQVDRGRAARMTG